MAIDDIFFERFLIIDIFVEILDPPIIVIAGSSGSVIILFKFFNSSINNSPQYEGRNLVIAEIDACALCEQAKASLIYTSAISD